MPRFATILVLVLAFSATCAVAGGVRRWLAGAVSAEGRGTGVGRQGSWVGNQASGDRRQTKDGKVRLAASDPPRPPMLMLENTAVDAGEVLAGQPVRFSFVLKNAGRGPLAVRAIPHCGCTVVHYDNQIAPGSEGALEAELRTSALGPITKTIDVVTSDPLHPKIQLTLSARVVPAVEVLPSPQPIFSLKMCGETVRELALWPREGVEITGVACSEPYVRLEVLPGGPSQDSGRESEVGDQRADERAITTVRLTIGPEAPLGKSTVRLTVATTAPTQREVSILLRCEKGIIVSPPSVQFRAIEPLPANDAAKNEYNASPGLAAGSALNAAGLAGSTRIVILSKREGVFRIERLASSDPSIQASVEPIKEGSSYRLLVRHSGQPQAAGTSAALTIHTDDPDQPTVEVPIRIRPQ